MIGIIVGLIVGIVLFLVFKKLDKEDPEYKKLSFNIVAALGCGLVAFLVADGIACIGFHCAVVKTTETTEKVASVELVALQDNSSVKGQFFLGSGSVNNKEHYAFYYQTQNGYKYETLDAQSSSHPVYIKHITSETETPHVDRYAIIERKIYTGKINPLWFSLIATDKYGSNVVGDILSEEVLSPTSFAVKDGYFDNFRYEIFVPEGSIQEDYVIDLE